MKRREIEFDLGTVRKRRGKIFPPRSIQGCHSPPRHEQPGKFNDKATDEVAIIIVEVFGDMLPIVVLEILPAISGEEPRAKALRP